ncbi:MAG: hypothetical protein R3D84_00990 [Paracoccaceae bacterium]
MDGADPHALSRKLNALTSHSAVRIVMPLMITAIAIFVLHRLSREVHWRDVGASLATLHPAALLAALLCVTGSYASLSLYDVAALRSLAPGKVPPRIAALAGASGFAISNFLGASWLTGSAVRMRIYSTLGVDLGVVAHVIGMTWLAFAFGLTLILGLLFSFHPAGLSAVIPIGTSAESATGMALLAG